MKVLFENYSFNPSTKQITLNTTDSITLEQLLVITNVTSNTIIYNFADPNTGGTISNNIITLNYNTTSMSSSDRLQIFLDINLTPASEETLNILKDQAMFLRRIAKSTEVLSTQDGAQRQRITLDTVTAGVTLPTVTTVGAVTSLTQFNGVDTREPIIQWARDAYANAIRNKITFS